MRGVPRLRRAISSAASISSVASSRRAARVTIFVISPTSYGFRYSTSPKRLRSGALISPWRVVAPMIVKRSIGMECVCADVPAPTTTSMRKSSITEYSASSTSGSKR